MFLSFFYTVIKKRTYIDPVTAKLLSKKSIFNKRKKLIASFSSSTFQCEVMRSEAGQERWNNIIRSLREEQGQIIRLNLAEWKCMGGKVLTLSSVGLIQFPALTPCHRYSSWAVRPRPTNFNICHCRCNIYHPAVGMDEYRGRGVRERGGTK